MTSILQFIDCTTESEKKNCCHTRKQIHPSNMLYETMNKSVSLNDYETYYACYMVLGYKVIYLKQL